MFESNNKPTFGSPTANMVEMSTRKVIHKGYSSPDDKENSASAPNIVEASVSDNKPKSRTNNGIKINSRAIFNFGGQNKVVLRNHKDSDDEYSTGTRTPMTPLSAKSNRSILSPNIFSPYREFFNKSKKNNVASPDSDDEASKGNTPVKSPTRTPLGARAPQNLNTITEEVPAVGPTEAQAEAVLAEQTEADEDALEALTSGLLVHKVCANDIDNQHKRVLYLDPTHTFLFWTEKGTYGMDEAKKAKMVRNLTRSKSWIKKHKQKEVTHDTKRTVLLTNIRDISVGSDSFSNYVQVNTLLGRTSKVLIFNIRDADDLNTFLSAMKALKM